MPEISYITSPSQMDAPGVYVYERAPAVPIRGQRNRVVGFGGQCVRGPIGRAVEITSYKRFEAVFGGRDKNSNGGTVVGHIWRALQGKRWGKLQIVRIAAAAAVKASFTHEDAAGGGGVAIIRVDAANPGTWANDVGTKVTDASNGDADYFDLLVRLYGVVTRYPNINVQTGIDNTNQVIGTDDATLIRVVKLASGRPINNAASTDGADADGFVLLGQVVGSYASVAGTDGSIADADYTSTAATGPIPILNKKKGIHACAIVGRSNSAVRGAIVTASATTAQRVWFMCDNDETVSQATAIATRAAINSQRISFWWNHVYLTDPITLEEIAEEPFLAPMCIISQTDPDIHVADFDNAVYTKWARRCYNELDRSDRGALDTGGVSFMWQDEDATGNVAILPGNGLTCSFTNNDKQLDARYMKDFILDAIAKALIGSMFKGNTPEARAERCGAVTSFLSDLARSQRYVQRNEQGVPQFKYVNDGSVNVPADQQAGDQAELAIVQLIPKNLRILLNAVIGTDATVTEQ
jgi:hypothetical protein